MKNWPRIAPEKGRRDANLQGGSCQSVDSGWEPLADVLLIVASESDSIEMHRVDYQLQGQQ